MSPTAALLRSSTIDRGSSLDNLGSTKPPAREMSLSSAVMRAVGVGLPPSGRLRADYWPSGNSANCRGRGRVEVLVRVVRIEDSSLRHNGGPARRAGGLLWTMNTDSSADKDGDRRHAQTPGPACIVRARDTCTLPARRRRITALLSEVLTRRTGEGVGAAAVAAGAAERQRTRATEGRSSGRCSVWASLCGQGWESAPCTRLGAQRARIATLLSGDVPGKERGGRRG